MSDDFTRCRMMWLDQIYDDKNLTPVTRDTAFRISRYFNRKGFMGSGNLNAWPSYETLAKESGCAPKTIQRAVMLLRERGHIVTTGNGGRSKTLTYFAVLKSVSEQSNVTSITAAKDVNKGGHQCPRIEEKVDIAVPKGGHLSSVKVDTSVLQTSMKKSLNKSLSAEQASDPAFEPFKAAWSLTVFDKLSKYPKSLPRPSTAFLRQMIEVEKRPLQVLDHQARHGWPEINNMFQRPQALDPAQLSASIRNMAFEMEPVVAGSDHWSDWKAEFEARGWPFPDEAKLMAFPRGGVRALPAFMAALTARLDGAANVVPLTAKAVGA